MIISTLNTLILLGAFQGFIIGALLWRRRRLPHRLLAWLIGLPSLASLNVYLNTQHWYAAHYGTFDAMFPFIMAMPIGPLLYLYIKSTLEPGFVLTRRHRLLFLPVLVDLLPYLFAWGFVLGVWFHFWPRHGGRVGLFIDTYNVYADIPRWLSLVVYVYYSARLLRGKPAAWPRQCVIAFAVFLGIWLVYLVPYAIFTFRLVDALNWYPVYLPLVCLTYWLGLKGYLVAYPRQTPPSPDAVALLTRVMEEDRLYLDASLNLDMLAVRAGLAPKTVSAVLNRHLQKNFAEFVGEYRVRAVQERIASGRDQHLTIAGIARECGFNSQATFQRLFKQYTGQTPSAYRKTAQIRS